MKLALLTLGVLLALPLQARPLWRGLSGMYFAPIVEAAGPTGTPVDVTDFSIYLDKTDYNTVTLSWHSGEVKMIICTNKYWSQSNEHWFALSNSVYSPYVMASNGYESCYYRIISASGINTSKYDVGKFTTALTVGNGIDMPGNNLISCPFILFNDTINYVLGDQLTFDTVNLDILICQTTIGSPAQDIYYYYDGVWDDFSGDLMRITPGAAYYLNVDFNHTDPKSVTFAGKVPDQAITNTLTAGDGAIPGANWVGAPSVQLRTFAANGIEEGVVTTDESYIDTMVDFVVIGGGDTRIFYWFGGVWDDFSGTAPNQRPAFGQVLYIDATHEVVGQWICPATRNENTPVLYAAAGDPLDVTEFAIDLSEDYNTLTLSWHSGNVKVLVCTNRYYTVDNANWYTHSQSVSSPLTFDNNVHSSMYFRIVSGIHTSAYDLGKYNQYILADSTAWLGFPFVPISTMDSLQEWFKHQIAALPASEYVYTSINSQDTLGGGGITADYYWDDWDTDKSNWFPSVGYATNIRQSIGYILYLKGGPVRLTAIGMIPTNDISVAISGGGTTPWMNIPFPAPFSWWDLGLTNLYDPPMNASEYDYETFKSQDVLGGGGVYVDYYYDDWGTEEIVFAPSSDIFTNSIPGHSVLAFPVDSRSTGTWTIVNPYRRVAGPTGDPLDVTDFSIYLDKTDYSTVTLSWHSASCKIIVCTNRYWSQSNEHWYALSASTASPYIHQTSPFESCYYRIISGAYTSKYDVGKFSKSLTVGSGGVLDGENWIATPFIALDDTVDGVLGDLFTYELEENFDICQGQSSLGVEPPATSYYYDGAWNDFLGGVMHFSPGYGFLLTIYRTHTDPKTLTFVGKVPDIAITNTIHIGDGSSSAYNWICAPTPQLRSMFENGLTNPVVTTASEESFDIYVSLSGLGVFPPIDYYYYDGVWDNAFQYPGSLGRLVIDAAHTNALTQWICPATRNENTPVLYP